MLFKTVTNCCVYTIYLRAEDGFRVAGSIEESDIELDRDVRAGWDLVGTRSGGVGLATLSPSIPLQIHTLLHCEQPYTLCEGTLHLCEDSVDLFKTSTIELACGQCDRVVTL